ncbi:MAG: SDR family NAD(P)-dependent oxidoreductase [Acidimicrobiales bacterium]
MIEPRQVAVVTGASSGIGGATARRLAAEGFEVVVGARRRDRLDALAAEIGGRAGTLDVTDTSSVEAFAAEAGPAAVLVNNAGGALGLEPVAEADEDHWRTMWDTNVAGVMRVTRALLPALTASGDGRVVIVGSVAGFSVYPGGAGYTAAKHGARAVAQTLRLELLGQPVRIIEIDPGMVETEFSVVRFGGDEERAAGVYEGMTPLTAGDVADCIAWAVTRPAHVNIDQIVVKPRDQAAVGRVHRPGAG